MTGKDNITSLFGKSPINPLQQHMKQAHSCLKEFGVFAKAANAEDWEKAQAAQISIGKKENKADKLKKKLRMNLPKYIHDAFFSKRFVRCAFNSRLNLQILLKI